MEKSNVLSSFLNSNANVYTFVFDINFNIIDSNKSIEGNLYDYITDEDKYKFKIDSNINQYSEFYFFLRLDENNIVTLKGNLWFDIDKYILVSQKCSIKEYFNYDNNYKGKDTIILELDDKGIIIESSNDDFKPKDNIFEHYLLPHLNLLNSAFQYCKKNNSITGFEVNTSNQFDESTVFRFIPDDKNIKLIIKTFSFNHSLSLHENYYQSIIDASADFIYKTDYLGNFVYLNETAKQKYGFNIKTNSKSNFKDWIRADYKPLVERFYQNQFNTKTANTYLEFPTITDEGEEVWVGQNVNLILSNGWVLGIQTTCRDITENKIIENELMEIQSKNQAILDSIPDSMFLVSNELILLDKKIDEHTYFFNINIGESLSESSISINVLKQISKSIEECFLNQSLVKLELNSDLQGNEQIFDIRIAHVSTNQCLLLIRNITESRLQQRKLQRSQEKEREALDAKQRYLSFMTHEIRTPLNAIIGLTDLIFDTNPTPKQMDYLKSIRSSSSILSKIINDVLDFNKLENNKIVLDEIDFSLSTVFKDVMRTCNVYSFSKPLTLSSDVDKKIPTVIRGDAFKLTQVLTNLISNAIKFTIQGSVKASAQLIKIENDTIFINFEISDTGIGIPEDMVERIFNSYEQLESTVSRKIGGTGLGLTISQKFIELMGGKIVVNSTPEKGSVFSFKLSFTLSRDELKKETPNKIIDLSPYHILLVEDNEMNQLVMSKYFNKWGISFDVAENGLEALKLIEEKQYNLILLDLEMPVMDGFETAEIIRNHENEEIRQSIIIALSASVFSEVEDRTKKIGFNDFIGKPINANYVYKKICEYLTKSNQVEDIIVKELDIDQFNTENSNYDLSYLIESSFNDMKYVKKMVDLFLNKTPDYIIELNQHFQDNNLDELKKIAHKFRASIAIMGISKAERAIHELETNISNNSKLDTLPDLLVIIKETCTKACQEIKDHVESNALF